MKSGGLFAGYGGLDMAVSQVFDAEPAWFSEIDEAPSKILAHHWPDVPNLGDITKIDWDAVEPIDILTGGFPCQDVSAAGKRAGLHPDTRSGLWNHMAYAIAKLRPRYVVAENVRGLLSAEAHSDVEPCPWCLGDGSGEHSLRALGAVLADLAELGYDTEWCGLRAAAVGAPHGRFRIFILARDTESLGSGSPGADNGEPPRSDRAGGAGEFTTPDAAVIGHEWSRPARDGWPGPADGGFIAADPSSDGRDEGRTEPAGQFGGPDVAVRSAAAANTDRDTVREQPVTKPRRNGAALARLAGATAAYAERGRWDGWTPDPIGEQVERTAAAWGRLNPATDPDGDGLALFRGQQPVERDTDGRGGADIAWGAYEPAIRRWERTLGRRAPAPTELNAKGARRLSPAFVEWMMGLSAGHVTGVPGLTRNEQLKALGNGVVPQQAIAALHHMTQRSVGVKAA